MDPLLEYQPPDGERILMVGLELVMALFCCLYAYPHVPSRILDDGGGATVWFSVSNIQAFRLALVNLLHESRVIQVCFGGDKTDVAAALTWNVVCNIDELHRPCAYCTHTAAPDRILRLNLYDEAVPTSCQQMFEVIASVYRALDAVPDIPTREFLQRLYQRYQLMRTNYHLPNDRSDRSGLLQFCSELTVDWLQPYFASCPLFLYPQGRDILRRLGTC